MIRAKFTAIILCGLLLLTAACAPAAVTPEATIIQTPSTAAARAPVITPGGAPVITPSTATVRAPVVTPSTATIAAPVITPAPTTPTTPAPTPTPTPTPVAARNTQIQSLGHATYVLTSANGTKILIDPLSRGSTSYTIATIYGVDAITVSHEHGDHNNVAMGVSANGSAPLIIRGLSGTGANQTWAAVNQTVKDIRITAIPSYHDNVSGAARGRNTIFIYEVDGLRIVHMGDLGHTLSLADISAIGRADVILVPIDAARTVDAVGATTVAGQLNAKVVIPMHYRTPAQPANFPGADLDPFLVGKTVVRVQSTTIRLTPATLPAQTTVMVLQYE